MGPCGGAPGWCRRPCVDMARHCIVCGIRSMVGCDATGLVHHHASDLSCQQFGEKTTAYDAWFRLMKSSETCAFLASEPGHRSSKIATQQRKCREEVLKKQACTFPRCGEWAYALLSISAAGAHLRANVDSAAGCPAQRVNIDLQSSNRTSTPISSTITHPHRDRVLLDENVPQTRLASASHCSNVRFILLGLHCSSCGSSGGRCASLDPGAEKPVSNEAAENGRFRRARDRKPCEENAIIANMCL
ncbi:hypothetical protein B0T14DRAFT_325489 [Immersiella caudata]|uniref:Uncharacterized protein n=1 Tax=Immersiella caudata TaxID=314043 RepID=A0AA39U3Z8_9PEZI|nr:hypothetical protein B0T14DRAFT_325489 [Immersiella caudata]